MEREDNFKKEVYEWLGKQKGFADYSLRSEVSVMLRMVDHGDITLPECVEKPMRKKLNEWDLWDQRRYDYLVGRKQSEMNMLYKAEEIVGSKKEAE